MYQSQTYTVVGVYPDPTMNEREWERFADVVEAINPSDAEDVVFDERGDEIVIAGVIEGNADIIS